MKNHLPLKKPFLVSSLFVIITAFGTPIFSGYFEKFNTQNDLLLAHYDCKTDVDDLHSVAGLATMLANPKFSNVSYHAVAGAYGTQGGLYVPPNELFEAAFGSRWSDAHANVQQALEEVFALAQKTLNNNGDIWIAEAGQSDFSAALVSRIMEELPDINTKSRVHLVQHSSWNEKVTTPEKLQFVKENTDYHKIPDGNAIGNGTPGFRSEKTIDWQTEITDTSLTKIWDRAIKLANKYNATEGRYNNEAIAQGGLDFSDLSEVCWIFGYEHIVDATAFFKEFSQYNKNN